MRKEIWIMLLCTLLISVAQILYKFGAARLPLIFTNWQLLLGLFLYGIGALLLIIALKTGEVSFVYPIIATSYIWVAILSRIVFGETVSIPKLAGIFCIIVGVAIISIVGSKTARKSYKSAKSGFRRRR